jgi:hypothetical protein
MPTLSMPKIRGPLLLPERGGLSVHPASLQATHGFVLMRTGPCSNWFFT